MRAVYVNAVGIATPGMPNWSAAVPILRGEKEFIAAPLEKYKPTQLPANEARRATELVRMAFRVCEEVMDKCDILMQDCASVFSSSGGDYPIIDQICRSLCEPERLVSPTQFHNSVHNSAAGYWSIATGSKKPSSALSAYDASFVAGLLEAMTLCLSENLPTLLVVYDIKPPYPLSEKRIIPVEFGVCFLLTPTRAPSSIARFSFSLSTLENINTSVCGQSEIELLRLANPAARALPLLEALAKKSVSDFVFEGLEQYSFHLEPCV